MPECPTVLQLWFDSCDEANGIPLDQPTLLGHPVWNPDGNGAVYRWAIDYVVGSDERWVVLGPYLTAGEAHAAYQDLYGKHARLLRGYRVVNEHCFSTQCGGKLPREEWTDG